MELDLNHPSWLSLAGTFGGYLVVLVLMTVLLFGVPYVLFLGLP
ncbi:hypothetical protein ACFQH6_06450 [Halobacteriaceae archaeon GCM10025711]